MPVWVTKYATIGQMILILAGMAAVIILAVDRIIDGAAAITALLVILGVGGGVATATHVLAAKAEQGNDPNDQGK